MVQYGSLKMRKDSQKVVNHESDNLNHECVGSLGFSGIDKCIDYLPPWFPLNQIDKMTISLSKTDRSTFTTETSPPVGTATHYTHLLTLWTPFTLIVTYISPIDTTLDQTFFPQPEQQGSTSFNQHTPSPTKSFRGAK